MKRIVAFGLGVLLLGAALWQAPKVLRAVNRYDAETRKRLEEPKPRATVWKNEDWFALSVPGKLRKTQRNKMPNYLVSGAGNPDVNGVYSPDGIKNGQPLYRKDATHWFEWENYYGKDTWLMYFFEGENRFCYYRLVSFTGPPDNGTWASSDPSYGPAPAPTVTEAAAPDIVAPTLVDANIASTTLTANWSENVTGTTGLSLSNLTPAVTLSGVSTTGNTTTATMSRPLFAGELPKLNYATGNFKDTANNNLTSFSAQTVTNNSMLTRPAIRKAIERIGTTQYERIVEILNRSGADATTAVITASDVPGLTFPVAANEIWEFEFLLFNGCSGVGGVKYALTFPAGATLKAIAEGMAASATTRTSGIIAVSGTLTIAFNAAALATGFTKISGTISNGATAGAVQLRFASTTAAQTSTVFAGSKFVARKI